MRRVGIHGAGVLGMTPGSAHLGGDAPHSLYFNGSNAYVDCGNHASVMDLHAGDFTVDVYYQYTGVTPDYSYLVAQGASGEGWMIYYHETFDRFVSLARDNWALVRNIVAAAGTWYYVRFRKSVGSIMLSVDAGAEGVDAAGGPVDTYAGNLVLGMNSAFGLPLKGRICYVHIWNNNQGALGAVPTSPFAVDGNTAARYTFSEGSGGTLGDDVGNSNGSITNATWSTEVPAGWSL